jgi:hypothetical protein
MPRFTLVFIIQHLVFLELGINLVLFDVAAVTLVIGFFYSVSIGAARTWV